MLDQTFDAFTGAAWETVSVAKLDISKITDNASDLAKLETYIQGVEDAFAKITDSATNLGAIKNRIGLQQDFVEDPDQLARSRYRPARRRGHEC